MIKILSLCLVALSLVACSKKPSVWITSVERGYAPGSPGVFVTATVGPGVDPVLYVIAIGRDDKVFGPYVMEKNDTPWFDPETFTGYGPAEAFATGFVEIWVKDKVTGSGHRQYRRFQ